MQQSTWNRSTNLFNVWMNTNTRQLTYLCMQKPAESIPNNNTQKCEWSVVHRLVITTCKDIQQSTTNIQHCNNPRWYLYVQKEKRERERRRERRRKREKEQTKQTLKPINHGVIYQTTIYNLFWFLYMSWQRETMYEYQTLLWQLIWQYNTMTPNNNINNLFNFYFVQHT